MLTVALLRTVGRVIKVATDFIGLLVLGIFNASIAADSIRSEFKYSMAVSAPGHRQGAIDAA